MAEKEQNKSVQRLYRGLNTDVNSADQLEGTYRFALNAVSESREGNINLLSTEEGNQIYKSLIITDDLGAQYILIILGSIYVDDNEHIIFGTSVDEDRAAIALLTGNGEIDILIDDNTNSCLNFKLANQISGEYRLRNGCEKTVYWVDGLNPVKTFTPSDSYYSNAYQAWIDGGSIGVAPTDKYNSLKFNLIKGVENIPTFVEAEVTVGGELKSGTYNFAIQYVDENGNETAWLTTSQLIPIYVSTLSGNYDGVMGSSNKVEEQTTDADYIYGSYPTNKRIELTIGNLDTSYDYYRIAIIEATSGTGLPTRTLVSENQVTTDDSFIFDGNPSKYTETAVENILLDIPDVGIAKHLEQVEDRLLLANTKGTPREYCTYQALASKITTKYVTSYVDAYDYNAIGNSKNPQSYFEKISYMGGEVYAFGIVYTYPDGTESLASHIPGRPATVAERNFVGYNDDLKHLIGDLTETQYNADPFIEYWQVYETASIPDKDGEGTMAFWEASSTNYVDKDNCTGGTYWGVDGYSYSGVSPVGNKIRHHKFPNRKTVPHFGDAANVNPTNSIVSISIDFKPTGSSTSTTYSIRYKNADTQEWSPYTSTSVTKTDDTYYIDLSIDYVIDDLQVESTSGVYIDGLTLSINNVSQTLPHTGNEDIFTEIVWYATSGNIEGSIGLLGIKFDNIELPDDAIGYKIVRAERDKFNRTVLSKGYSGTLRTNDEYLTFHSLTESTSPPVFVTPETSGNDISIDQFNKYFLSPKSMFENDDIVPNYIKVENQFYKYNTTVGTTDRIQGVNDVNGGWFDNDGFDWLGTFRLDNFKITTTPPDESNHQVLDMTYLPYADRKTGYNTARSGSAVNKTLYNCSMDNKVGIGKLWSQYTTNDTVGDLNQKVTYVSMNVVRDIHPILDNIKYYQTKNNISTSSEDTNYGGDIFISHFYVTNSLYQGYKTQKRIWETIVKSLIVAITAALAAVLSVISLGTATPLAVALVIITVAALALGVTVDTIIIVYQTFAKDYQESSLDEIIVDTTTNFDKNKDDTYFGIMTHSYGLFMESDINIGLREQTQVGVKGSLNVHSNTSAKEYMTDKFLIWDNETTKYVYSIITKPEIYQYNVDFSRENQQKVWFALPSTYDCCSLCLEEFPDRTFYSEKSFIEERADSYGKFLPLNYITVPGEHGEITNIFSIKNALYAHTKSNLWYIPQNVQERLTGDVISLIGTGGFFSSTPRPVFDDKIGSAGSTQKYSTIKTTHGVFFVDDTEGKIYVVNFSSQTGTQIKDLAGKDKGLSKWLLYNIPFNLYNDIYQLTSHKLTTVNNPANYNGIGFIAAHDFENNRILITKRDYVIASDWRANFAIINNSNFYNGYVLGIGICPILNYEGYELVYNIADSNYYHLRCTGLDKVAEIVSLTDRDYFEDRSWTLSYSIDDGAWISFHSYLPSTYIYDHKNLYSVTPKGVGSYDIWKHNISGSYLNYYGVARAFIIDLVALGNPLVTSLYENIILQTLAMKNNVEQRYVTFNKFVAYNERQCSGELTLYNADNDPDIDYMSRSITNTPGQITIKKLDKDWMINNFRDMRVDYSQPIFLTDWDSIKDEYFIDKVVNTLGIDIDKDWMQLEKFRDKYLRIRFIFDNSTDTKLTTKYTIESEKPTNM